MSAYDFERRWYCSARCPGVPGNMGDDPLTRAGHHRITACPSPEVRARYELVCATRGQGAQLALFSGTAVTRSPSAHRVAS